MMIKVKIIKPCMSKNHLYGVLDAGESGLEDGQEIYAFDMPQEFDIEEVKPKWAKLTGEQVRMLGMSDVGVTLIDYSTTPVNLESFHYNAEEFFSEEELDDMPWFGTHLFEESFKYAQ